MSDEFGRRTFCQVWTAAILCIMLFFGTAAASPRLRASMIHIIKEVFPLRTHFQFSSGEGEDVPAIDTWYTLQNVPEGYVLTYEHTDETGASSARRWTSHIDGQYSYISLVQCELGGLNILDTEGCTEESVLVGEHPGFLYTRGTAKQKLIWSTGTSVFVITVIGKDAGRLDLCAMAEAMVPIAEP